VFTNRRNHEKHFGFDSAFRGHGLGADLQFAGMYSTCNPPAGNPASVFTTLNAFRAGLANATATPLNVLVIGDSIFAGTGASPSAPYGGPYEFVYGLQMRGGYHTQPQSSPFSFASNWTQAGTWTDVAVGPNTGTFYTTLRASGNSNTRTFTTQGDMITLFYYTYTDSAAFAVSVDSVSQGIIGGSTTNSYTIASHAFTGFTNTLHTVVVTAPASNACYPFAQYGTVNATGVGIINAAVSGTSSNLVSTAAQYNWIAGFPNLGLIIYEFGQNDIAVYTPSQYQANVDAFFSWASSSGYSLLAVSSEWPSSECGTYSCRDQLDPILASEAQLYGFPYISIKQRWGTYAQAQPLGLYLGDGSVHPSQVGHNDIADYLLSTMVGSIGYNSSQFRSNQTTGNLGLSFNALVDTSGTQNTVCSGGNAITTGSNDMICGIGAGGTLTTGSSNTCIGEIACSSLTTGSFNTGIGAGANFGAVTSSSVQLGPGTNSITGTIQYASFTFMDQNGNAAAKTLGQRLGAAIASASTIAPTSGITHITGTATISTITIPTVLYGTFRGCLTLIPDGLWSTTTGGNIAIASTAVVGKVLTMCDDGTSWYPSY
jgi:hypothetical protein